MKKTFPHKAHLLKTSDNYNSQSSMTSTLKGIVSSELKLDKKSTDDTCRSLERTGSSRIRSSATRFNKVLNYNSNNTSLIPDDESVRLIRDIIKEEICKEVKLPPSSKYQPSSKEDFPCLILDTIADLKREVG
jgi:hypothetical protein